MADSETLISHLVDLRKRLLNSVLAFVLVFACLMPWAPELYAQFAKPLLASMPQGGQMVAIDVTTPFFVPVKVTMMVAFVLTLPWIMFQLWRFVAPGLYQHEKKLIAPLVISSSLLFLGGMAFAYFLVFPVVFGFINAVAPEGVAVMTDIDKYLSFTLGMFLAFGAAFQVPVAVVLSVRMGIVTVARLKEIRPYVIVGAFILGAVLTPPDVLSQFMLALPVWFLYETGVLVAQRFERTKAASSMA